MQDERAREDGRKGRKEQIDGGKGRKEVEGRGPASLRAGDTGFGG